MTDTVVALDVERKCANCQRSCRALTPSDGGRDALLLRTPTGDTSCNWNTCGIVSAPCALCDARFVVCDRVCERLQVTAHLRACPVARRQLRRALGKGLGDDAYGLGRSMMLSPLSSRSALSASSSALSSSFGAVPPPTAALGGGGGGATADPLVLADRARKAAQRLEKDLAKVRHPVVVMSACGGVSIRISKRPDRATVRRSTTSPRDDGGTVATASNQHPVPRSAAGRHRRPRRTIVKVSNSTLA